MGTNLDLAVLILYFVGILAFGTFFQKYTKTTKDFFLAGQRFSWWLIAFSCVATLVGSYSFVKYSTAAYNNGISSTMSYLNDWPWFALLLFGWLPILYFSRTTSIPEYFERRFDRRTRIAATVIILIYMVGYIGINFYTLGVALHPILNWPVMYIVMVIAAIAAIYVTAGGQTAVIMTDLAQGVILLLAGLVLFFLGIKALGGFSAFWSHLPENHKLAFAHPVKPASFNSIGVFWQDGMANSAAFWFMNQGIILRLLSARSVKEGRKALVVVFLVMMPLATLCVCGAGWIGRALVNAGLLPAASDPKTIFVAVTHLLAGPGLFGLILAALTAALMSTADTLINATSVVFVNDIWRPLVKPNRPDRYYLRVARISSVATAFAGVILVPVYIGFKGIYQAHAAFTAAVTPPMVVTIMLGSFWKRCTARGAFWTLTGGFAAMLLSMALPVIIVPFSHGMEAGGSHLRAYTYMRALYGLIVSSAIGISVSLLSRRRDVSPTLLCGDEKRKMTEFKGSPINEKPGATLPLAVKASFVESESPVVFLSTDALRALAAEPGDLVYVSDKRRWTGGLRSFHARVAVREIEPGAVEVPVSVMKQAGIAPGQTVHVEKQM